MGSIHSVYIFAPISLLFNNVFSKSGASAETAHPSQRSSSYFIWTTRNLELIARTSEICHQKDIKLSNQVSCALTALATPSVA